MEYLVPPKGFSQKIDYRPPVNLRPEWKHLFKPDYKYLGLKLGARILTNVFVNHYGLVIKNGILVKGCAPNIGISTYDKTYLMTHWRKATEQMLVAKYGKSVPSIKLDDNRTYLVIHSPWFSYYFWLTECLPRLLMVKEHLKELTLIYPESWKNNSFVNETLDLFPELQKEVIPSDVHMWVKNLVLPEVKPWTPMVIPDLIFKVRDILVPIAQKKLPQLREKTKIYISRDDATFKKIYNKYSFEKIIKEFGYEIHTMSGKSIFEQINLILSAKSIVTQTGAGMVNLVFLQRNASVLDLTSKVFLKSRKYKFHFKKIVDVLQGNYLVQFCDFKENKKLPEHGLEDLIVDLTIFEKNLLLIE